MRVDHDVHVHTFLSGCCNDLQCLPEAILQRAAAAGLKTLGFADHLWDAAVPGASEWYQTQDLEHVLVTRRLLPADTRGVRVLVGCETEYCGGGKVGISAAARAQVDFVLLPVSHFHMKGFVIEPHVSSARDVASLLVERFNEAVGLGVATGIAHPFLPGGFGREMNAIIAEISDGQFRDCFGRAAEAGVSIEMSVCMFPGIGGGVRDGFHDETFLRVLGLAKAAGCKFHFASDAHALTGVGLVRKLEPYTEQLGLGPEDVLPLFRSA